MVKCIATYSNGSSEEIMSRDRENCEYIAAAWAHVKGTSLEMLCDWDYDC